MRDLYGGALSDKSALTALDEMRAIRRELSLLPPSQIVWDIEHPGSLPPWGAEIGSHVENLAQYFVTSTGRNLVDEGHRLS